MTAAGRRLGVLFVSDLYPRPEQMDDGVFVIDQALALRAHADVALAAYRTASPRQVIGAWFRVPRWEAWTVDGVDVWRATSFVPTARSTSLLVRARARAIERAARQFERRFGSIDVIHAHCAAFAGEAALRVGRSRGVPVVITEHYSFAADLIAEHPRLLDVYDEAGAVLAVSRSLADRLRSAGVRCDIEAMPNTVDAARFVYAPTAPPGDGAWRLVCIGRDHASKDLPTLLRAFAQLTQRVNCELTIIGAGSYEEPRRLAAALSLADRVRFAGALPRARVAAAMREAHVLVSSSRIETFGVAIAEALCTGRPVVATDSGGPRDVVGPGDGRIVPAGEPAALADAIEDVLARYAEYDGRAIAARAAERFGPTAFAAKLMEVYGRVMRRAASTTSTTECHSSGIHETPAAPASAAALACSVIIPTADRPEELRACLESLARQTRQPDETIVADASRDDAAQTVVVACTAAGLSNVRHHRCTRKGAAVQRNEAIDLARGEVVFFLDDDVVCEPSFVAAILDVFASDERQEIGAVSGTIVNQTFSRPSRTSRAFMRWMAGRSLDEFGGRLIGPAWNLLPSDAGDAVRPVDWVPSGCVAYRAAALGRHRFNEALGEYAYGEDVYLSASVGREMRLVNTGQARVYHADLGLRSHRRPRVLGRAQVVNRWLVMRDVLGRTGMVDRLKLAMLQLYFGVAELRGCVRGGGWGRALSIWRGRFEGLVQVVCRGRAIRG